MAVVLALSIAPGAFASDPATCDPKSPALHVAVFNTAGNLDQPYVQDRGNAMATFLPQTATQQNLDVMCLTELREPLLRSTALQGFTSPDWNIYQPTAADQTGCQDACFANSTVLLQSCANSVLDQYQIPCAYLGDFLTFQVCMQTACPNLWSQLDTDCRNNECGQAVCTDCAQLQLPGESSVDVVARCSAKPFDATGAAKCQYRYGGETGGTLVSRYPFIATDYHQFTLPATQPGLANWGITYGKIQTPLGPVHLFCGSQATTESGMTAGAAQPLNATQSQDVLNYIQTVANGEPAIYMADTGSGPAVTSSPTGAAGAQWPDNFNSLQSGLSDVLLANKDGNSLPAPAPACTYGCSTVASNPASSYVDHILTSGKGTNPQGYSAGLCADNGTTLFTANVAQEGDNAIPLSAHFGVSTDVHLESFTAPVSVTSTNANGPYGVGKSVAINVTFNLPVSVTGSPQLALDSGGTAVYSGGSGTSTLTFTYMVGAGQSSAKLDYSSTGALTLNGGGITDSGGNPVLPTLPSPGAAGSLSANKSISIDTTAPTVLSYAVQFGSESFTIGSVARTVLPWQISGITVTFSEPVTATTVSLSGVSATSVGGSGTATVTWTLTTPLAAATANTAIKGSGNSAVTDLAGNPLGSGADFAQTLKVLWGDYNGDGVVSASDTVLENGQVGQPYNVFADLNGDGLVNAADVLITRQRTGTKLP